MASARDACGHARETLAANARGQLGSIRYRLTIMQFGSDFFADPCAIRIPPDTAKPHKNSSTARAKLTTENLRSTAVGAISDARYGNSGTLLLGRIARSRCRALTAVRRRLVIVTLGVGQRRTSKPLLVETWLELTHPQASRSAKTAAGLRIPAQKKQTRARRGPPNSFGVPSLPHAG